MSESQNYVFLLGGNDAEMERIREVLTEQNVSFRDKNLGWGAKASAYKNGLFGHNRG